MKKETNLLVVEAEYFYFEVFSHRLEVYIVSKYAAISSIIDRFKYDFFLGRIKLCFYNTSCNFYKIHFCKCRLAKICAFIVSHIRDTSARKLSSPFELFLFGGSLYKFILTSAEKRNKMTIWLKLNHELMI